MTNYKPHIFSLFALFVCGNAVITLPFYNAQNPFLILIITAITSTLFVIFSDIIIKITQKNKTSFFIVSIIIGLFAIFGAITTLYDYVRFVSQIQLPQANIILLIFTAITTAIFFATCRDNAIYKYCLLMAVFCAAVIGLVFVGGIKYFDFSHLNFTFVKTDIFTDTASIFFRLFLSLSVSVLYVFLTNYSSAKTMVSGTLSAFLAVTICLLQGVMTLAVADMPYPYINAVSAISTGSLFTRLDGLVYFVFFATAIIKIAVCIKTTALVIKRIVIPFRT